MCCGGRQRLISLMPGCRPAHPCQFSDCKVATGDSKAQPVQCQPGLFTGYSKPMKTLALTPEARPATPIPSFVPLSLSASLILSLSLNVFLSLSVFPSLSSGLSLKMRCRELISKDTLHTQVCSTLTQNEQCVQNKLGACTHYNILSNNACAQLSMYAVPSHMDTRRISLSRAVITAACYAAKKITSARVLLKGKSMLASQQQQGGQRGYEFTCKHPHECAL